MNSERIKYAQRRIQRLELKLANLSTEENKKQIRSTKQAIKRWKTIILGEQEQPMLRENFE